MPIFRKESYGKAWGASTVSLFHLLRTLMSNKRRKRERESTNVFIVFFLYFPLISVFFGTGPVSSNEIDKTNELLVRKNIYFTVDKRG